MQTKWHIFKALSNIQHLYKEWYIVLLSKLYLLPAVDTTAW